MLAAPSKIFEAIFERIKTRRQVWKFNNRIIFLVVGSRTRQNKRVASIGKQTKNGQTVDVVSL